MQTHPPPNSQLEKIIFRRGDCMPFGSKQSRKTQMLGTKIHQPPSAIECEVQFYLLYSLCIDFVTPVL